MAFFDFLDTRKLIAKRVAQTFTQILQKDPHTPVHDIIDFVLGMSYSRFPLKPSQVEILERRRHTAVDIFSLCHLIAEVELLSHLTWEERYTLQMGGESVVFHTYRVMDQELIRRGFQPGTVMA